MRLRPALLVLTVLLCTVAAQPQTNASFQPQTSASSAPSANESQLQSSAEPQVTQYTLPPGKLAKAKALYMTRNALMLASMVWGILVLIGVLAWKAGPRLRDLAEAVTRRRVVQAFIFVPLLLFLLAVLGLPLDMYEHRISLQYGLSVQHWGSWFWDWTKGQLVSYIVGALVIWLMYAIIRRSPRRWWFYCWLVSMPLIVLTVFLAPVVLDPIFNKFEPLQKTDPALVADIQRVLQKGSLAIPDSRIYEMKASDKVTTYNAYVTGIGATKRVVVWDNTANELPTPETLFIFGHEMGHYVLNHIWKGLAFATVLSFFMFHFAFLLLSWSASRWGTGWGIHGLGDWASLPLILLVASVLSVLTMPVANAFSRHLEHQADIYGLEVVHGLIPHSSEMAALTFEKLGEKSYDYPHPNHLLVFWTYSHPDIASRLKFALNYRPWDKGQKPKYVK